MFFWKVDASIVLRITGINIHKNFMSQAIMGMENELQWMCENGTAVSRAAAVEAIFWEVELLICRLFGLYLNPALSMTYTHIYARVILCLHARI